MSLLIGTLFSGLMLSCIYALAALGFVVIYRATGVFNFAQGEFMAIGAYLVYLFAATFSLPFGFAIGAGLLGCVVIGGGIFLIVIRPLTAQPMLAVIIVTMGVSIVIKAVIGLVWGPLPLFLPRPWAGVMVDIGEWYSVSAFDLVSIGAAIGTYAAVIAFLHFSPIGLKMRAAAENPTLASQRGVNLGVIFAITWALAALVSGVAGAIFAGGSSVTPSIAGLALGAFPAAIVGGFNSVIGTLLGAFVVGMAETGAIMLWGSESKDVVAAAILLGVLIVRPYGFFGNKHINRV